MPSYCYKGGFRPYKDLRKLSRRVLQIIGELERDSSRGRIRKIAEQIGVSKNFVWQVSRRLEKTRMEEKKCQ